MVDTVRLARKYSEHALFGILLILWEAFILVILSVWAKYPEGEDAIEDGGLWYDTRDVSIMIFFGFGYLMTFLRRYGFSAISYSFMIAGMVCQWSIVCELFWEEIRFDHSFDNRRNVGVEQFLNGLFCSGAVLISYGAILGKINPTQMLVMAFFEPFFFWLNYYVSFLTLKALDIGGGIFIHEFGAYFGLAMTLFVTSKRTKGHSDNVSCYSSDIFSLAGTLFLYIMWPSFNAVTAEPGEQQVRALTNTFLSLCGAVISSSIVSRWISHGKFEVVHLQNSTLAGGVVMGTAANLNISVAAAIACGLVAGAVSVLGYRFLTPLLSQRLGMQDICGVHNLHGIPGVLGAILSVFATAGLGQHEPERSEFPHGAQQAGYQTAAIAITFGIAVAGGLLSGAIIWLIDLWSPVPRDDLFNDRGYWQLPSDYEWVVDREDSDDETEMDAMEEGGEKKRRESDKTFLRPQGSRLAEEKKAKADSKKGNMPPPKYNRTGSLIDVASAAGYADHDRRPPTVKRRGADNATSAGVGDAASSSSSEE
eukprot:TRINITY_DN4325_c0_g1_i1.p1 TRINITY_DN4325_c0_g1~~TRINITY_DN4325_c0_g1_i1.p1  ORF type:complete len:536 (-),score=83.66 TRINITY_DN4325_c0_g1_i1:37-1644(-)